MNEPETDPMVLLGVTCYVDLKGKTRKKPKGEYQPQPQPKPEPKVRPGVDDVSWNDFHSL